LSSREGVAGLKLRPLAAPAGGRNFLASHPFGLVEDKILASSCARLLHRTENNTATAMNPSVPSISEISKQPNFLSSFHYSTRVRYALYQLKV
jgi:hypothetical protein